MGPKLAKMCTIISMFVAATLCAATAHAGAITLTLTRITLINVNDAAGVWQHQSGDILKNGVSVGQYMLYRRVTNGANSLNVGMTTLTLFFTPSAPGFVPQNLTLQGVHTFGAGNFRGSVSAASNSYTWIIGADAVYISTAGSTDEALTLTWTGSPQLTLP